MIKVTLSSWKMRDIVKQDHSRYELLQKTSMQKLDDSLEDVLASKNYTEWWAYINNIESIPDWLLPELSLEVIRPMNFMERGVISNDDIVKAVAAQQVHLPGNELLKMREVTHLDDACTLQLQEKINEGWRILAVCPQPNQRRPDYLLGRGFPLEAV